MKNTVSVSEKVLIWAAELNNFFKSSYADGSMEQIAEKYGVQAAVVEQK